MKNLYLIPCLTIILAAPSLGITQSAADLGLVLRGGNPSSSGYCKPDKDCRRHRMTFENNGSTPIIIVNPTLGFGTGAKEVIFYYREFNQESRTHAMVESHRRQIDPDPEKLENFKAMALLLNDDRPPENMTIVLKPGETFAFEESFAVDPQVPWTESAMRAKRKSGRIPISYSCDQNNRCYLRSEEVRIVYEFSFLHYVPEPDLLDKLSVRWRRYGRLPIGMSGTYTITSEPIK
jgi:hypothetical protein